MAGKINYKKKVLDLISSGNYDIVQQMGNSPEEPYEGCEHNLHMVLNAEETTATLLAPSDPQAREDGKTYKVEYDTFMGHCTLIIWEI